MYVYPYASNASNSVNVYKYEYICFRVGIFQHRECYEAEINKLKIQCLFVLLYNDTVGLTVLIYNKLKRMCLSINHLTPHLNITHSLFTHSQSTSTHRFCSHLLPSSAHSLRACQYAARCTRHDHYENTAAHQPCRS